MAQIPSTIVNLLKKTLDCNNVERDVREFENVDTFNTNNKIKGYLVVKNGKYNGSMIITSINGVVLEKPNIVYNIPNLNYPYTKKSRKEKKIEFLPKSHFKSIKGFTSYCFMNKWNGTNIVIYKYKDNENNVYVSGKTKGYSILQNNDKYDINFFDLTMNVLKRMNVIENDKIITNLNNIELNNDFLKYFDLFLKNDEINGISFELCGTEEKHLVKYDFDIDLKPLQFLFNNGKIKPCIEFTKDIKISNEMEDILLNHVYTFGNYDEFIKVLQKLQNNSLQLNENYRKENNLQHQYEYDHFITEGNVLYLLDNNGFAVDRNYIFKLKPTDVEQVHWEQFGEKHTKLVDEAVKKVELRQLEMNIENLRQELDMGDKGWGKFGKQVLNYLKDKYQIELTDESIDKKRSKEEVEFEESDKKKVKME
ncbi:hypothetical protein ABK040_002953 [Willaertia magna]